jgi:environmental stress-induced protein Ves
MTRHRFDLQDLHATPWKNGGGLTREVLWQPTGASLDDFDWRVSVAQIDSDGPFSAFPGIDRVITLIDGVGVQLRSEGAKFSIA